MIHIKHYGYFRTGTNFAKSAIQCNFTDCYVLVNELGEKHNSPIDYTAWLLRPDKPVPPDLPMAIACGQLRFLHSVKDPYGWLDSYLLYREHQGHPLTEKETREAVATYSRRNATWSDYLDQRAAHGRLAATVRYESLLADFGQAMQNVADALKLVRRGEHWRQVTRRVDPQPHLRGRNAPLSPRYWLDREYLGQLTPLQKRIVAEHTNWPLMRSYGYSPL